MNYYGIELHSHTRHSDGDFETHQLVEEAVAFGYDILTITDHNTTAPYQEWVAERSSIPQEKIVILPGIEWTTYFGHMLVIGCQELVDWRDAKIDTIDQSLIEIKKHQGIVGVAHPYAVGSPMCTGCHWDFEIQDWSLVDFIEVWNRTKPDESYASEQAYYLWLEQLKQGHRIACSAGRDWHREEGQADNIALTYIGLDTLTETEILKSLKQGNFYITLGPRMVLTISQNQQVYYMGDQLTQEDAVVQVEIQEIIPEKLTKFGFEVTELHVFLNETRIHVSSLEPEQTKISLPVSLEKGYLRIECFGNSKGQKNRRLVLSNPFYIQ